MVHLHEFILSQNLGDSKETTRWEGHDSPECFKWRAKHEPIAFGSWANHDEALWKHITDICGLSKNCTAAHITLHCQTLPRCQVSVNLFNEHVSKSFTLPLRCRSGQMLATPPKWIPSHFTLRSGPSWLPPYITLHLVATVVTVVALLLFPTWESNDVKVYECIWKYQTYSSGRMMKGPKQTPIFWHRVSRPWGKFADRDKRMSYNTAVCVCVYLCFVFVVGETRFVR